MKKTLLFLPFLLVISISLNAQDKPSSKELINKIENHLVPAVLIEGEPVKYYSIKERMIHHKVPGISITFFGDHKILWTKTYGYTSFDSTKLIDENTLFQAASISKPVAAMAALTLVQEGKIALEKDINTYLKNWKIEENKFTKDEKVTLARLLSHSAGLTVHGFGGYAKEEKVPSLLQILNGKKPANSDPIKPDTVPGAIWRYSGGGYTVMQKALEDVSSIPFSEYLQKNVLNKIGMNNSRYAQPLPEQFHKNASIASNGNGEQIKGKWHIYPEMAAAGLWTTPSDLAKFAIEVQKSLEGKSNKVLSKEFAEKMTTRYKDNYGLGFSVQGNGDSIRFGHGGSNQGYRCILIAHTKMGEGVAIMTNADNGGSLYNEVLRSISDVYKWNIFKPTIKKIVSIKSEKLKNFAGKYQLNPEYIIEVSIKETHVIAKQLWDKTEFEIYPESDLKFFERGQGLVFEFEESKEGKIESFKVYGQYVFKKVE